MALIRLILISHAEYLNNGPLLFLLYINDLNFSLNNAIACHIADDTCIMFGSCKPKTLETVLNCDLKKISDWLKANRLLLNISKEAE